ncbi:uncharacterized protein LOC133158574 isoform X2 [Syngnathus typhle]|uniref:uncharacterized protein LOC133158574 isoform X2 n=1 Tax=Syngnathus typhle TaxID=161592 RepID=UPI002A698D7B|nr:uncharacterized protein LOC133158574 isoform X2 [Syngnathus typhle]
MGQLLSSEEEISAVKHAIGNLLYRTMLEGGAVRHLRVVNPLLLANHNEDPGVCFQAQMLQLQGEIGNKVPAYLKDLIGRLSSFSDEPRLAGLLGLAVSMVMDLLVMSSSGLKKKATGSSSSQRVRELQEVMEEYLKRCRINLADKSRLVQDSLRMEAQLSFSLTQLKISLVGGDCDSQSLRFWASGAAFHTQMLIHLAVLEGLGEPLSARAVLDQYKEDLAQILPAYRCYKINTVCVVKCRGVMSALSCELHDEGSMTGLTLTDRETGKSVSVTLAALEAEIALNLHVTASSSSLDPDLITSHQYAQAYVDRLFSGEGPVEELKNYFTKASDKLKALRFGPPPGCLIRRAKDQGQCEGHTLETQDRTEKNEQRSDKKLKWLLLRARRCGNGEKAPL